jgi:hypothetical protein
MFSYRHQTLLEHIANIQKRLFIIPIVLMSFIATPSRGDVDSYVCNLESFLETWGDANTAEYLLKQYKKDDIFVDRKSGIVQHLGLGNTSYQSIELLHRGDSENAFKVVGRSQNGWQAHYMVIEEYAGREEKRFLILEGGGNVWRGVCR